MRELLFKNLTSCNTHRRILKMSERVAHNGVEIMTLRRCTYLLKERIHVKSKKDIGKLKMLGKNSKTTKRHFHVIRRCDSGTGENRLFCKVDGLLYIVMGNYVYLIAFTNSFMIGMKKAACPSK